MINVAFCFKQESILNYVQQEIQKGFSRRGFLINALPAPRPDILIRYAKQGIFPDIILFSDHEQTKNLFDTILFLKQQNDSMISILTKYSDSNNTSVEEDFHILLNPFYETSLSRQELWSCVCRAYEPSMSDQNTFSYYQRPFYYSTPLNHILYFSSEGRCVRLVTGNSSESFYGKLNELEKNLESKNCRFIRIHQSYLVNTRYIDSYNYKFISLTNGEVINISKPDYYQDIKRLLNKKK